MNPTTRRAGWMAALGLALTGCGSLAPPYERPPAPVAERFIANGGAAVGVPGTSTATPPTGDAAAIPLAAELAWQDFFGDARLKQLIGLALHNNRDLRVAVLRIEQARAQFQLRRADEVPTLGAGLAASRLANGSGSASTTYSAGLVLSAYELDLFGRVRSLSDAALAQVLSTEEARKAVQINLVAAVANAHLALQADEELLAVTRQTLDSREASWRLVKLKFEHGAASEIDLRQAESLRATALVAQAQQTRQRLLEETALVLLIGQPWPEGLPAPLGLGDALTLPELPAGLPSEVLARRPDVRAAEQQLIAANAGIGAARAAFFPRITLTGSLGVASGELSGLTRAGASAWSLAPQLLQPLFDGGRNQAGLAQAQVGRDIALAQYEQALQVAFREVADALGGRTLLTEQRSAQRAQLEAEASRARLAELRYRSGTASFLELLDARRSLFAAQQALIQTQLQQWQNGVALYKALGGGWTASPE